MESDSVSIRPAAAVGRGSIAAEILEERPTYWVFRVEEKRIHMSRDAVTVSPAPMGLPTSSSTSKAKRGLDHLVQGNVIEFTPNDTPEQKMVAEVLSVDFKEKMVELRIVKPWYGAIMKLPLDSIGQVASSIQRNVGVSTSSSKRRKEEPREKMEATLRIFRPHDTKGKVLVIFNTEDMYDNRGFLIENDGPKKFYRSQMEEVYIQAQKYEENTWNWGELDGFDPKKYKITSLTCAAEHIHFLRREGIDLEHVHTFNLTLQGDYPLDKKYRQKDNDHLITDYYQWDKLLEERMRNVTYMTFHIVPVREKRDMRPAYIIPKLVWTMVFEGRFRMAQRIFFGRQTIHEVLDDDRDRDTYRAAQNMLKVAKVCPFVPVGAYESIRKQHWYAAFVMTYLCCESLPKEYPRLPPRVYALFAHPIHLSGEGELAIFDTEWLEYESPEKIISELSPSQQRVYNELLVPLSRREAITVPVTFERAVMAVSLGAFYGVNENILHYIIHTWCMRLYQEAPKSLMDRYNHSAIRHVLKESGMVDNVEDDEEDDDDGEEEDDLEGEDEEEYEEEEEEYDEEEEE